MAFTREPFIVLLFFASCFWYIHVIGLANERFSGVKIYRERERAESRDYSPINNFVVCNVFISCHPISKDSISTPLWRACEIDSPSSHQRGFHSFLFFWFGWFLPTYPVRFFIFRGVGLPPNGRMNGRTSFLPSISTPSAINLARIVNFKHFIKQTKRKRNRLTIIAWLSPTQRADSAHYCLCTEKKKLIFDKSTKFLMHNVPVKTSVQFKLEKRNIFRNF